MLTDVITPSKDTTHLIDDQLYLLKLLGIRYSEEDAIPVLELTHDDREKNAKLIDEYNIRGKTIIGIHPGASWETKRWKYYGSLAQKIGQIYENVHFFVFSAKGEEGAADEVYNAIKSDGLNGHVIKESLADYIRIIEVCDLMICNDSGSAHIASAYGIPTIVLFGPFDPSYCKPIGRNSVTVISHNLACKPCMSRDCKRAGNECLNGITVDEVLYTVKTVLTSNESKSGGYLNE